MARPASGTQAVDRAALLVSSVVHADIPLTFSELVDLSELPKSTVSRLLAALERTQLVERNEDGEYVAGSLFWLYSIQHDPWEDLVAAANPMLEEIRDELGETVNLGVARGSRVVHVAQADSTFVLGARDWTMVDVPSHCSALGKALFACNALPLPTGRLEQPTERSLSDRTALEAELRTVRSQGFATAVDELEIGLTAIAAPVLDGALGPKAAIGISGPTPRLQEQLDTVGQLLVERASTLATALRTSHRARVAAQKAGVA